MNQLINTDNRETTNKGYHKIWTRFNKFVIRLDKKPESWEHAVTLYALYLVDQGIKSATLKSYVSAIKKVLVKDGYDWNDNKILLTTLTHICKLNNDVVYIRLPIQVGLLDLLLLQLETEFDKQLYLEIMYKSLFLVAYYGLMRIGELAQGVHTLKAKNIHSSAAKNKLLLVLYSSKTHRAESNPQQIKITEIDQSKNKGNFCPFKLTRQFLKLRGPYTDDDDNLYVFRDNSPVTPEQVRKLLRKLLCNLQLDAALYDTHSFCIGRATDLYKEGRSLEYIKRVGRWRSNAVYRYLRDF